VNRFKNILVVANDDSVLGPLLARGADLARRNRATITLLGVVDANQSSRRVVLSDGAEFDVREFLVSTRRDELAEVASEIAEEYPDVDIRVAVTTGTGFVEVIRHVEALGHDLVLVASDADRRRVSLAGSSMAMHLLRKCPVPVWVDAGEESLGRDVAVALGPFDRDGSRDSMNVTLLELATSLAHLRGGDLHVVHAWRLEGESMLRRGRHRPPADEVDELVADAHRRALSGLEQLLAYRPDLDVHVEIHLEKGEAGSVVPDVIESVRPGVVVMGTVARAGIQGVFMGNTAERVLGTIAIPVLAVKPRGFKSPVAA
jgi:nucleotide-binding universal stress UspA family protein